MENRVAALLLGSVYVLGGFTAWISMLAWGVTGFWAIGGAICLFALMVWVAHWWVKRSTTSNTPPQTW